MSVHVPGSASDSLLKERLWNFDMLSAAAAVDEMDVLESRVIGKNSCATQRNRFWLVDLDQDVELSSRRGA